MTIIIIIKKWLLLTWLVSSQAFVIVVGAGGVGSAAAHVLLRTGVRKLRIIDPGTRPKWTQPGRALTDLVLCLLPVASCRHCDGELAQQECTGTA